MPYDAWQFVWGKTSQGIYFKFILVILKSLLYMEILTLNFFQFL